MLETALLKNEISGRKDLPHLPDFESVKTEYSVSRGKGLKLAQGIERACYVSGGVKMQNFGGKKEFFGFNLVAQYRYCPPIFIVDCVVENDPVFPDRIFRPYIGAPVQELVVVFGLHFDQ
jgi:hypothetical protein